VLPVAAGDIASNAFGLNPFGIHFGGTGPGGHASDGHPGWDVEFQVGASVLAAADGVVQSVFADSFSAGRSTIQAGALRSRLNAAVPRSTIDLQPDGGTIRRGAIDIVGDTMRLNLAAPGASRPGDLSGASVYRTGR
jgi:hypothetical protein